MMNGKNLIIKLFSNSIFFNFKNLSKMNIINKLKIVLFKQYKIFFFAGFNKD